MDEELRNYLTAMEDRLKAHVDVRVNEVISQVDERFERAARATAAEIGALHTYIQQAEGRLTARIDGQGVRIDSAALLQSGARQVLRTFQNQEELSKLWQQLDERGNDLEKRLFALERRPNG